MAKPSIMETHMKVVSAFIRNAIANVLRESLPSSGTGSDIRDEDIAATT